MPQSLHLVHTQYYLPLNIIGYSLVFLEISRKTRLSNMGQLVHLAIHIVFFIYKQCYYK